MERGSVGARDRFGGARLAAALLAAVGGAAATSLHLRFAPAPEQQSLVEVYLAAMGCAGWAGWRILGLGLGGGPRRAALRGLTGAVIAATIFCIAVAVWETVASLGRVRFTDVTEMADHLVRRTLEHATALGDSPVLLALAAVGIGAGLAAEALHHVWRWDRNVATD